MGEGCGQACGCRTVGDGVPAEGQGLGTVEGLRFRHADGQLVPVSSCRRSTVPQLGGLSSRRLCFRVLGARHSGAKWLGSREASLPGLQTAPPLCAHGAFPG